MMGTKRPLRMKLRARRAYQQQAHRCPLLDQQLDHFQGRSIRPMQILDRDHQGLGSRLPSVTLTSPFPQNSGRGTGRSAREADPTPEDKLPHLESALLDVGLKPEEAIPLIAPLLNLQVSEKYQTPTIAPELQHRRLLVILVQLVLGERLR
jgi:hypothetical protein